MEFGDFWQGAWWGELTFVGEFEWEFGFIFDEDDLGDGEGDVGGVGDFDGGAGGALDDVGGADEEVGEGFFDLGGFVVGDGAVFACFEDA